MNRGTVVMSVLACLVGAVFVATPAVVVGYPVYTDGSFAIKKLPHTTTPLLSGFVELPLGDNHASVRSDIALVVLPGSVGTIGLDRLSNGMALVAGFVDVNWGVGIFDFDDQDDFGGGLQSPLLFMRSSRFTMEQYVTPFNDMRPNGDVFPIPGTRFWTNDFTLGLGVDLNNDQQDEEIELRDISFTIGQIFDTRFDGLTRLDYYRQTVTFSGSIQPDFGPITLSGLSTLRQD